MFCFGQYLVRRHNSLRLGKDKVVWPLVKILPADITPNQITIFRFLLALSWLAIIFWHPAFWQIGIFFLIYFFDLLDGALARNRNKETIFGFYFDPLADRLNHIVLYLLVWRLTHDILPVLKFFVIWEIVVAILILVAWSFRKNQEALAEKINSFRTAAQFVVKICLWVVLVYEIFKF